MKTNLGFLKGFSCNLLLSSCADVGRTRVDSMQVWAFFDTFNDNFISISGRINKNPSLFIKSSKFVKKHISSNNKSFLKSNQTKFKITKSFYVAFGMNLKSIIDLETDFDRLIKKLSFNFGRHAHRLWTAMINDCCYIKTVFIFGFFDISIKNYFTANFPRI